MEISYEVDTTSNPVVANTGSCAAQCCVNNLSYSRGQYTN